METGFGVALPFRKYESYESLKKHVSNGLGSVWDKDYTYEIILHGNQASTGSDARIQSTNGGETTVTAPLSKTEETWVFAMAADDESVDGETVTLTYKSNDGVSHTTTGTLPSADNSVETAFSPAVSDGYCITSLTISSAATAQNLGVGPTGDLTRGIIASTATSATEANMHGVGDIWVRGESNHADSVDEDCFVDYMTPWGEVKRGAIATTDAADGTTEERCLESDGSTTVKDCYNIIQFWAKATDEPTANSGFFFLTDDACANVDGSGNDVFGCISETEHTATNLTFTACSGCDTWLGKIQAKSIQDAVGDTFLLKVHFTPKGESYQKTIVYNFAYDLDEDLCIPLEEASECYVEIADLAGVGIISCTMTILSAKEV